MFLNSIGTALPARRYTKSECWDAFTRSQWFGRLDARAHAVAKAVLGRDNGIEERWLAIDSLEEVFAIDPDTLQKRFESHAPALAADAGRQALQRASLDPKAIDAVIVTTCTGYLCPGLTGYVVERLGLRNDVLCFDLVGQGCAGALPNWQLADAMIAGTQARARALDLRRSMQRRDVPGQRAGSADQRMPVRRRGGCGGVVPNRPDRPPQRAVARHRLLIDPAEREALRFEHREGMLRNILTRAVPRLAAEYASEVLTSALAGAGLKQIEITNWIMHAGGRDVLLALEERLSLPPHALRHSREALRRFGNLSSAFVYFVLDAALREEDAGGWWWMSSFGAGFTCHGALLSVE